MSEVTDTRNSENNHENAKRLKGNLNFWSPLNDNFNVPDKKSVCTWHKNVNRQTTPHSTKDWRRTSKILPNALAAIGNTPMIKLNKIPQAEGLKCDIYVESEFQVESVYMKNTLVDTGNTSLSVSSIKPSDDVVDIKKCQEERISQVTSNSDTDRDVKCEFLNPGGSVKDRIAFRVVEDAEKQGLLKPGYTIIEPTSGNTGIGLAMAAAVKGYRCVIVMSEKMSNEKVSVLTALGAEIVRTPVTADSNSADGLFGVTHRLRKEIPNSVILDQYSNPGNPLAHYDTTAEEIYDQCDKNVDMIVIGAGTGGTVCGIGRKFKEISPETKIVAADPEGSLLALPDNLNNTDTSFYEVEGIGYDFIPTVLDRSVVDIWIKTNDKDSLPMARRLIKEEGLLVGSSCGAAMVAAIKAAKDLEAGKKVVVILPDSIRNYMTKFVSDQWMEARGLMPCVNTKNHWWWDTSVSEVKLEKLQIATTNMNCERVLNMMKKSGFDQIPVVDNGGGIIGMLTLQNLMNGLISGKVKSNESIDKCIVRIYPKVYQTAILGVVSRILEKENYVIVLDAQGTGSSLVEKPVGIVTAIDLLQFIQKNG